MPFISNPMSSYNKNNPLVILAKEEYSYIMDTLQGITRSFLIKAIVLITFDLFFIALGVFYFIKTPEDIFFQFASIGGLVIIISILYAIWYRNQVHLYMYTHPSMIAFDKISKLEMGEILMLNNEDLLDCLHKLYRASGGLEEFSKYFNRFGMFLIGGDFLIMVYWITLYNLLWR